MNQMLIPVVAATLTASAILVLGLSIVRYQEHAGIRRSMGLVLRIGAIRPDHEELRSAGALGWGREVLDSFAALIVLPSNRRWIRGQLVRAGRVGPEHVHRVLDAKLLCSLVGAVLGAAAIARFGLWGWGVLITAVAVGYLLPDLLVYNTGLKRTEQIRLSLPDALDLLDLCVESGLSLQAAMAKVADVQAGPVAEEFARVLQEMRLGVSRSDALHALADRATQSDLKQLVSAILQAESLGIPIAAVLREQASEMRAKRSARAREAAQKVPVKILAPLMLCFLPGLFIIILGPALITVVDLFLSR